MAVRTYLQVWEAVADAMGVRVPGTLTAASTTALTIGSGNAARYFRSNRTDANNRLFEGVEVYVNSGTVPVPNPNTISAYVASTSVLTPGVTYGTAPDATATFDVITQGVWIQDIKDGINDALRQLRYVHRAPLTMVTEGDMDASGTTNWTATNATLSKVTNTNAREGARSLRVLATAAAGQAQSDTIFVDPTNASAWFYLARVRADIGTARFIPYDVTNSANISLTTDNDWTLRGWGWLGGSFTLPATCEALAARLVSVANADDTYWDSVIMLPVGAKEAQLPSWIIRADDYRRAFNLPADPNRDLAGITSYRTDDYVQDDPSSPNTQFWLRLDGGIYQPVGFEGARPYDVLSADADTTFCDRSWIELAGTVEALRRTIARGGGGGGNVNHWKEMLYGGKGEPGKLRELKRMNWDLMPDRLLDFKFSRAV